MRPELAVSTPLAVKLRECKRVVAEGMRQVNEKGSLAGARDS